MFGHLELTVAIANHFLIESVAVVPIIDDSFLLNIAIGLVERDADKIGSKISEKDIVACGIEAHAFELDIVVDFICYFKVVHL